MHAIVAHSIDIETQHSGRKEPSLYPKEHRKRRYAHRQNYHRCEVEVPYLDVLLAHARIVRPDYRHAQHIPTGETFVLTLREGAIVDAQPDTPVGAALIGGMNAVTWATAQDWWLDPPASERQSA
jgi:hypothetical protein